MSKPKINLISNPNGKSVLMRIYIDKRIVEAARNEHEWFRVKTIPTSFYERILIFLGIIKKSVIIKRKRRMLTDMIPKVINRGIYPEAIYKIK